MEIGWYLIAEHRRNQLVSGEDLTFNELLLPQLNEMLPSLEAYSLALSGNGFSIVEIYEPVPTDDLMKN